MLRNFLVAAHRVGHARAGVDAAQGGADQREEDRERLDQHEGLAVAAQHHVADDHHHVADWRSRTLGVLKAVERCS